VLGRLRSIPWSICFGHGMLLCIQQSQIRTLNYRCRTARSRTALCRVVVSNRHPHALPARTRHSCSFFNGQSRATTSVDAATTQSSTSHAYPQLPRARTTMTSPICGSLLFRKGFVHLPQPSFFSVSINVVCQSSAPCRIPGCHRYSSLCRALVARLRSNSLR